MTARANGGAYLCAPGERPPVVLAVDSHEWALRVFESVVGPRGFAVVRALTTAQALELLPSVRPDCLLVATRLIDADASAFLRAVRQEAVWTRTLPIIVALEGAETMREHVTLLDAGAWALLSPPMDADLLVAQLGSLVRVQREIVRAAEEQHLDAETGLYSLRGLRVRAREIVAAAYRDRLALTCVVLEVTSDDGDAAARPHTAAFDAQAAIRFAEALRQATRRSDLVARLGPRQFAVVAAAALARDLDPLLQRLTVALETSAAKERASAIPLGYRAAASGVTDYRASVIAVDDLLQRATSELRAPHSVS